MLGMRQDLEMVRSIMKMHLDQEMWQCFFLSALIAKYSNNNVITISILNHAQWSISTVYEELEVF